MNFVDYIHYAMKSILKALKARFIKMNLEVKMYNQRR